MEVKMLVKFHQNYVVEENGKKKYSHYDLTETVPFTIPDIVESVFPVAFITKTYDEEKKEMRERYIRYYDGRLYCRTYMTLDDYLARIDRRYNSRTNYKPPAEPYRLTKNKRDDFISGIAWKLKKDHYVVLKTAEGDELWRPCGQPVYKIRQFGDDVYLDVLVTHDDELSFFEFLAPERTEALAMAEYWYARKHIGGHEKIKYHGLMNSIEVKMPELCERQPSIYTRCKDAIIEELDAYLAVLTSVENRSSDRKEDYLKAQEYRQTLLS